MLSLHKYIYLNSAIYLDKYSLGSSIKTFENHICSHYIIWYQSNKEAAV